MKNLRINLIALAGVIVFAGGCSLANAAAAQSVNLQPIASELMNSLAIVLAAFIAFISGQISLWLSKKLKLDSQKVDDTIRGYLNEAARRGIQLALVKLQTSDLGQVNVKNQVLAIAGQYVVDRVPDALKRFGFNSQILEQYLEARLGDIDLATLMPSPTPEVQPAEKAPVG
jgi:hypothetical protein